MQSFILLGTESTRFQSCWTWKVIQISLMAASSLGRDNVSMFGRWHFIITHKFSMGLKSGLLSSQSLLCLTSHSCSHCTTDLVAWHGAPSCMKMFACVSWNYFRRFLDNCFGWFFSYASNKFTNTSRWNIPIPSAMQNASPSLCTVLHGVTVRLALIPNCFLRLKMLPPQTSVLWKIQSFFFFFLGSYVGFLVGTITETAAYHGGTAVHSLQRHYPTASFVPLNNVLSGGLWQALAFQ